MENITFRNERKGLMKRRRFPSILQVIHHKLIRKLHKHIQILPILIHNHMSRCGPGLLNIHPKSLLQQTRPLLNIVSKYRIRKHVGGINEPIIGRKSCAMDSGIRSVRECLNVVGEDAAFGVYRKHTAASATESERVYAIWRFRTL